jgi:hypothetical protein
MTHTLPFASLSDAALLDEAQRLASAERHATTTLIACLVEVDARRLHLAQGCSSLFGYCTSVLRLSEHAAYGRIEAARCAQRFPRILELLTEGSITLTTVSLIAAQLTPDNQEVLLEAVRRKSRREVERLIAELRPQPDVAPRIRKLPGAPACTEMPMRRHGLPDGATHPQGTDDGAAKVTLRALPLTQVGNETVRLAPSPRPVIAPLAPRRYRLQLTVSEETHGTLRRLQDLLRHTNPSGDIALILDRALVLAHYLQPIQHD